MSDRPARANGGAVAGNGHRPAGPRGVIAGMVERLSVLADEPVLRTGLVTLADEIGREPEPGDRAVQRVVDAFGLSPFERDLLVLAGLPEEHEIVTTIVRRTHPLGEPWLAGPQLATVLGLAPTGRRHLRTAIDAGPLHRYGLIVVGDALPRPEASIRLAEALWSAIRGGGRWPASPARLDVAPNGAVEATDPPVRRLTAALEGGRSVVLVSGGRRSIDDLAALVAAAVERAGRAASFVEAGQLTPENGRGFSAHALIRRSVPVLLGRPDRNPLPLHPGPVVVCLDELSGLDLDDRPVISIDLGPRSLADDVAMWRRLLPDLSPGPAAVELAGLLRVDSVRARRAVGDARATARLDHTDVSTTMVVDRVRRRSTTSLPPSVRLVHPHVGWDSLVTTARNHDLLTSIIDRVRHQAKVLLDWEFDTLPGRRSRGARALFAGPPGTGKTLSAEIVAGVLGLDLLVVDLSALVSKWLGETEKNISEVFDAAERCQAVLFFDEADSVFARRTDGNDAQGRWANLETAHLLTRMEQFDGLVILASNLRGNIDEAFVRRLDVIVELDEPGVEERRRLWARHLPPAAPCAPDVDLDQLAELYPVTGGLIRNAALDAGFRAAAAGLPITQLGLAMAVEREFDKAGRTFPGIPRILRNADPDPVPRSDHPRPTRAQGA